MHTLTRRQPSLDLRKAARVAGKQSIETFTFENDMEALYRAKAGHGLRLTTSSPLLSAQYQSDEEQPSPRTEEYEESGMSEYASCEDDDLEFDGDDEEIDFEVEDSTHETTFISSALAIAVPIQCLKPSIVDISILAPMAKRSCPISRPQSASYATFIRVKAPSPTTVRSSIYGSSLPIQIQERPAVARNFSTPMTRNHSLSPPESMHSGTSPSSSSLSLSNGSFEEGDALIRESDDIQMRQTVLTGTEWELESPTPTSYAAYDPFGLAMPTLKKTTIQDIPGKQPSGWKRLGLKTKILAAGRRAGWN